MAERIDPRESEYYQARLNQLGGIAAKGSVEAEKVAPYQLNPEFLTESDFDIILRTPEDEHSRRALITSAYRSVHQFAARQKNGITRRLGSDFISRDVVQNMVDGLCSEDPKEARAVKRSLRHGIGEKALSEIQLLLDLTAKPEI